jgi:hypothetical protein
MCPVEFQYQEVRLLTIRDKERAPVHFGSNEHFVTSHINYLTFDIRQRIA